MIKQLYYIDGKPKWITWGEKEKIISEIIDDLFKYSKERDEGINSFHLILLLNDILEKVKKVKNELSL